MTSDQTAIAIYMVMARDVVDALEMIQEGEDREALRLLHGMLTATGNPNTDHELNTLFARPVSQRLDQLGGHGEITASTPVEVLPSIKPGFVEVLSTPVPLLLDRELLVAAVRNFLVSYDQDHPTISDRQQIRSVLAARQGTLTNRLELCANAVCDLRTLKSRFAAEEVDDLRRAYIAEVRTRLLAAIDAFLQSDDICALRMELRGIRASDDPVLATALRVRDSVSLERPARVAELRALRLDPC